MKVEGQVIDVSLVLEEGMVTYPGDLPFSRRLQRDQGEGDSSTVSIIETSAHVGTHVDAPVHFVPGAYGVEAIPVGHLVGPCFVADCRGEAAVTAGVLEGQLPAGVERVLLRTDNSARLAADPKAAFDPGFVYLDRSGAELLVERGVELVGIDYLSIDKKGDAEKPAHNLLLPKGITIVEGVVLDGVAAGEYFLVCAPLKIRGADGAPARVFLIG